MEHPCISCPHKKRHKEKCLQVPNTCSLLIKYQHELDRQTSTQYNTTKNYSVDTTSSINLNSRTRAKLPNL